MTGFARAAGSSGLWRWAFELKTVNAKGLDLRLRMPAPFDRVEVDARARRADDGTRGAVSEHAALVQHDHMIVIADLVDQMRRPQHGDPALAHQAAHMSDDRRFRRDIQPHCGLVQHQHAGLVQQRPRNLHAPHLSARQLAHRVAAHA